MPIETLHWLRLDWLWAALPLALTIWLLARARSRRGQWQQHIDPQLLPYLVQDPQQGPGRRRPLGLLLLAAALALLALLGPAVERAPAPLHQRSEGLVIVLDLSPSMLAEDIKPSRLQQARFKIRDILALRREGQTGLVVFAGDAFVVAPLTDDGNTLLSLLGGLEPAMMPLTGSNPLAGLQRGQALLQQAGLSRGRLLLIGDGISDQQLSGLKAFARQSPYELSILGVGSRQGAPIPLPEGGFARDGRGEIIIPSLSRKQFAELASAADGRYRELSLDDSDIRELLGSSALPGLDAGADSQRLERQFDQWRDAGAYLVLALLPLALLCFRRGWLLSLALPLLLLGQPSPTQALEFADLWSTPNQRGAKLMTEDPQQAAQAFEDPMWRGSAHYRAGDYAAAAEDFARADSANAHYNRGNALAKAGRLDEALAAYEQALQREPDMADARRNRDLLEQLKQQQEQQQEQQSGSDQGQSDPSQGEQDQAGQEQSGQQQSGQNQSGQGEQEQQAQQGQQQQNAQSGSGGASKDNAAEEKADADSQSGGDSGQPETGESNTAQGSDSEAQQAAEDYARGAAAQQDSESDGEAGQPLLSAAEESERPGDQPAAATAESEALSEQQQALEQWLRNIPDDPGGLLRRKFHHQFQQRREREELPRQEDYAPY